MEAYKPGVTSSSTEEVWGFWDIALFSVEQSILL